MKAWVSFGMRDKPAPESGSGWGLESNVGAVSLSGQEQGLDLLDSCT